MEVANNFAILIGYRTRIRSGVPAAGAPQVRSGDSTYARKLAVNLLY
jgi:hypothetical protein